MLLTGTQLSVSKVLTFSLTTGRLTIDRKRAASQIQAKGFSHPIPTIGIPLVNHRIPSRPEFIAFRQPGIKLGEHKTALVSEPDRYIQLAISSNPTRRSVASLPRIGGMTCINVSASKP